VVWKDLLFWIADNGIAHCCDARTGEIKWQERLPGDYKASPLAADGRIYFLNRAGTCTVVAASAEFQKLAVNEIKGETLGSPAVSDGHFFFRAQSMLYCIGESWRGGPFSPPFCLTLGGPYRHPARPTISAFQR
jgi:outer membrane protein assembly factor BamB